MGRILCKVAIYQPEKDSPRRICFTAGGNLIDYLGKTSAKAANITTVKILFNSILSTDGARFITLDLQDFTHNGHIYMEIQKGMYGLSQVSKIANDQLIKNLRPHRYTECPITPGLLLHDSQSIQFYLFMDDFGIKYTYPNKVTHPFSIQISIPNTVPTRALSAQTRRPPIRSKILLHGLSNTSLALNLADKKRVQEILGTLLYYAGAIDTTMLPAIGSIPSQQTNPTKKTIEAVTQSSNY